MRKDQFFNQHQALNIQKAEMERKWQSYLREQEQLEIIRMQAMYEAQILATSAPQATVGGGGGGGGNGLPSNCIQLVVDTTDDTYFYFNFNSNGAINFTVDWGDGTTHEDSGAGGYYEESHTYPESNQQYTVRICFDDPTIVTSFVSDN